MNNLSEYNENLHPPLYLPSHLESLKQKHEYFEVPDLETKIQLHNNPHYWFQQGYKSNNFKTDSSRTSYSMKIRYHKSKSFPVFINISSRQLPITMGTTRSNTYFNFPQVFTETELLPYLIIK